MNQESLNKPKITIYTVKLKKNNKNNIKKSKKMKNSNKSLNFILTSKKSEATTNEFKNYIGISTATCSLVNPDNKKLSEFLGRDYESELVYTKKNADNIDMAMLMFPVAVDTMDGNTIKILHRIMVVNAARYNKDKTKIQVVDEYGDFAWATIEDYKAKNRPMNSNGPAKCTANYRYAYQGEEELVNFLKARLNIGTPWKYENDTWVIPEGDYSDYMCRLDHVADYFKGDVKEIQDALNIIPDNQFKVCVGLKVYNDKYYHNLFYHGGEGYMKMSVYRYTKLEKELNAYKDSHPGFECDTNDIHEYKIKATDFSNNVTQAPAYNDPFASPSTTPEVKQVVLPATDDDLPF